jgi:MFS family permease
VAAPYGHWLREALATYEYWVVIAGIFFINVVVGGLFGHFVAIAGDLAVGSGNAASMVSAASLAMMAGQFAIGITLDLTRTPRLVIVPLATILCGALCIHFAQSPASLFIGIVLVGLGSGSEYGLLPYVLTRLFGLRSFGQLYGIVYAASAVSYGIGPFAMGWTFDHLHSYSRAFMAFEAVLAVSMALLLALKRYNYSPQGVRLHA